MIEIDDICSLKKESKFFKKWKGYTFRTIDVRRDDDGANVVRLVRNMRNDKMGSSSNCYITESENNLKIVKKNKRSQERINDKKETEDLLNNL